MVPGRGVMVAGGLYHVNNRFARGEGVFSDPAEAVEFTEKIEALDEALTLWVTEASARANLATDITIDG
ncbi:MAG: hypothetical protein K8R59_15555 [Thermoanaerobaculales bacterium]|nr:hypothetical protein [Thermoanaerobaculales bacterium]